MALRDTPAQDSVFRRNQENDRIASSIQQSTPALPRPQTPGGSPTPGRAASALVAGAQQGFEAGAQRASQWRDQAVGEPNLGPPITQAEIDRQRQQADAISTSWRAPAGTQPRSITMSGNPQGGATPAPQNARNTWESIRDIGRGVGGAVRQADQTVTRFTDGVLGIEPLWGGSDSAQVPASTAIRDVNSNAINRALQMGADAVSDNRGYYTNRAGERQYVDGTQRASDAMQGVAGISVLGDFGAANAERQRAIDIRQQMIDAQSPNRRAPLVSVGGQDQRNSLDDQIRRLSEQAGRTRDIRRRAAINSQIRGLQSIADRQASAQQADASNQTSLQTTEMTNQALMQRTLAQAAATATSSDEGMTAYNQARARYQNAQAEALERGVDLDPPEMPDLETLYNIGREDLVQMEANRYLAERDEYDLNQFLRSTEGLSREALQDAYMTGELDEGSRLYEIMERLVGPVQEMAMGGEVPTPMAGGMQMFADGGEVLPPSMSGNMPMRMIPGTQGGPAPMAREYEQYSAGAQQLGLPVVPYEDFINLMPNAAPQPPAAPRASQPYSVMGFADGGEIPMPVGAQQQMQSAIMGIMRGGDGVDVSGREVFDPDPNAGTDSIPAIIDGQQPAALDSGEFVIPESVVRFHGLDKLRKLIAQAEMGSQDGANGRTEGSGSAVRA